MVSGSNETERLERTAKAVCLSVVVSADPRFVGVHWFEWRDQPLTGRFDGECYQIGLVDVADTSYPEMVVALRELASELYRHGN